MLRSFIGGLVLLLVAIVGVASVESQDTLFIDFKIKDQFDRVHMDEDYAGQSVVIVGFDRKGSDYRDRWVAELRDSLRDTTGTTRASVLPVGTLRGVPFFLKGFLKGKFPKEDERWMLLDWKGAFTKAYRFASDSCSFLVFDAEKRLRCRSAATEMDYDVMVDLLQCVRESDTARTTEESPDNSH